MGGVTFILSQAFHIPFNNALTQLFRQGILPVPPPGWAPLFNATILGLSAGLWEETARYGMLLWWAKDARTWRKGILLGAGHGGMEAILLGILVLVAFFNFVAIRNADLSTLVPADQLTAARIAVKAYWSAPWYDTLLGALERLFTLPVQISLAVLVTQAFIRNQRRWWVAAVVWHALADALAVVAMSKWGVYITEATIALFSLFSIGIIFALRQPELASDSGFSPEVPIPPMPPIIDHNALETPEKLDQTRFNR
jgi:uncharacterized membrane protein YhfC